MYTRDYVWYAWLIHEASRTSLMNSFPTNRGGETSTSRAVLVFLLMALTMFMVSVKADESADRDQKTAIEFAVHIEPILRKHCFQCHGAIKQEGGLRLDLKRAALAGGDSGKVLTPGKSSKSPLLARLVSADPEERMPAGKPPLNGQQIALIKKWIDGGATWLEKPTTARPSAHWAFQKIKSPAIPAVKRGDTIHNALDAFVVARLQQEGIQSSPPADRQTLLRRLSLDLRGLPPSPNEIRQFVSDRRADADQRLVDRLLNSPHFGERWGRHWLDLARYADSDGYEMDHPRPHAWRWRDWVINAFNRDLPFDQFTLQQLAGDLLPRATLANKIATGFHRNTLTNRENGIDKEEFRLKAIVDRVNTTGTVWLGLTLGCAECHSHKYDPISQRDYYRIFAFFNDAVDEVDIAVPPSVHELVSLRRKQSDRAARLRELRTQLSNAKQPKERQKLAKLIAAHNKKVPQTISHAFTRRDRRRSTYIHLRGNFLNKGAKVAASTLSALPQSTATDKEVPADRLDLARWIVDPVNPLTARVAVNHIWQHLFGAGLVTTPDNFGKQGSPPSHPKLLDWLANRFVRDNWSRKSLIRLIVSSATYRQSSGHRADLIERDPNNRLLARQNRFRLTAELVRDQHLAVSGILVRSVGGPGFRPRLPDGLDKIGFRISWKPDGGESPYRRGMYIFYHRNLAFPMLRTFDHPRLNVSCTRRERSNTPLQALTQLNDEIFVQAAQVMGRRLINEAVSPTARIERAFLLCLARRPRANERRILMEHYQHLLTIYRRHPGSAKTLTGSERVVGSMAETAAWIALSRTIMNLDEFITRE